MNVISVNRSVLTALIGSVLAFGLSAPSSAQARPLQDSTGMTAQGATPTATAQDEEADAAETRRRGRGQRQQAAEAQARGQAQEAVPPQRGQRFEPRIEAPRQPEQAIAPQQMQRDQDQQQAQQRREMYQQRQLEQQRQADAQRMQSRDWAAQRQQQQVSPQALADNQASSDEQNRARILELERRQAEARELQRRESEAAVRASSPVVAPQPGDSSGAWRGSDRDSRYSQDRPADGRRISDRQQQDLIRQQRQQAAQYSRQVQSRDSYARQHWQDLQRHNRNSQYRYQQSYWERMRRQMQRNNWQSYNYNSDPYFYTAPSYRYYRGGNYYTVNRYAADLLRQAINYGYAEGIRAGEADRYDGWRFSYRDSYAYQDANYGYRGFYVSQSEYNYYFRQGFRRGYEDGYYGRRRYGRSYNGSDALFGTVLSLILNLQSYRY
jgi:hypothetical protein